jgi:hypothetical protein
MMKRIDPFVLSDEGVVNGALAEWAFGSHSWVEYYPGYYKCEWCGLAHTSVQGISKDFKLCGNNYCVKRLLQKIE